MRWIPVCSKFRPLVKFYLILGCELGKKDFTVSKIGKITSLGFANKENDWLNAF